MKMTLDMDQDILRVVSEVDRVEKTLVIQKTNVGFILVKGQARLRQTEIQPLLEAIQRVMS